MKAICLDSDGAWFSDCTLSNSPTPNLSHIDRLQLATEEDFELYPVLCEGFYDSHLHPTWMARLRNQINCQNKSAEEILLEIEKNPNSLVYGHGWQEEHLGCTLEHFKELLDRQQKKEIFLYRICGHMAYSRSHGFIKELELKKIPAPTLNIQSFDTVLQELKTKGLDSWSNLQTSAADYTHLENTEGLIFADVRELDTFNTFKKKPTYMKFFLDGSLGARTAWLSQPYSDKEVSGMQLWSDQDLFATVQKSLDSGFLLAFHAIGDAALDQLLKISDRLKESFKNNLRDSFFHRIEHLQVCRDDQISKIKQQGFWSLGLQPSHRYADLGFSAQRLGALRLEKQAYRLKSFLDADLKISLGSDAPIVSYDPEKTFHAISTDSRNFEKISPARTYKLFCVEGRQNAGIPAKKLLKNSHIHLSKLSL